MTVGFSGEVAEYYAKYRRGYPPRVLDALQGVFGLGSGDLVLDLGCGTGQLAVPLAPRVRAVVGMDPEPDMLRLARESAEKAGVRNAAWVLGADTDVPGVAAALLDRTPLGAVVIGQAVHWMRHEELFPALFPLCRPGGGVAVVANGTPLWLQDTDWSRALRSALERHFGRRLEATCGTGEQDRQRYARALREAGFTDVREMTVEYEDRLSFEQLMGALYSAVPAAELPPPEAREAFADRIQEALPRDPYFTEAVRVSAVTARVPEAAQHAAGAADAAAGAVGQAVEPG